MTAVLSNCPRTDPSRSSARALPFGPIIIPKMWHRASPRLTVNTSLVAPLSMSEKDGSWEKRDIIYGALVSRPRSPRMGLDRSPSSPVGEKGSMAVSIQDAQPDEEDEEEWDEKAELSLEVPGIVLTEPDLELDDEESDDLPPALRIDLSALPVFSPPPPPVDSHSPSSLPLRSASPTSPLLSPNQILLLPPSSLPVPQGPTTPPSELAYTFTAPSSYPYASHLYSPAFARFLAKGSFGPLPAHQRPSYAGGGHRGPGTRAGAAMKVLVLLLVLLMGGWHVYTTLSVEVAVTGSRWAPDFRQ